MECKLFVGQPVICTYDDWHDTMRDGSKKRMNISPLPQKNKTYTIRTIEYVEKHGVYVRLKEIVLPPKHYIHGFHEPSFHHSKFKPIDQLSVTTHQKFTLPKELTDLLNERVYNATKMSPL